MDLDLSISPDVFGLRAFDTDKPITCLTFCRRILHHCVGAGRRLCSALCVVGRRMWSASAVTPRKERTRCFATVDRVFVASVILECTQLWTPIACHLELAQLWRCPVEWCTVWKGSGRACLEHLAEKHRGSMLVATTNVAKFFSPWTVTHDVWHTALHPDVSRVAVDALLFHEAGRRLVHCYRVYKDPFPHPALRDGVVPRLLSCVCWAMAIARLTHLKISIPSSGAPPGQVPTECVFFGGGGHPSCLHHIVAKCHSRTKSPCWERRSCRSVHRCYHHWYCRWWWRKSSTLRNQ